MKISEIQKRWSGDLILGSHESARHVSIFAAVVDNRHATMGCAYFAARATALIDCPETGKRLPKPDKRAEYAREAIKYGAQLVIAGRDFNPKKLELDDYAIRKVFVLLVDNPAQVFAELDAILNPVPKMQITAVTGTNGKSSTVSMVRDMLRFCRTNAFSMGTLGVIGERELTRLTETLTTPIASTTHQIFRTLHRQHDAEAVVLEASSQGLAEHRLSGIMVDVAAFTNFTTDHLDYHELDQSTFEVKPDSARERYFAAKLSLLLERVRKHGTVVLNCEMDRFADVEKLIKKVRSDLAIITYGKPANAEVRYEIQHATHHSQEITFTFRGKQEAVILPLPGAFQASNAACSLAIGLAWSFSFPHCVSALAHAKPIPGRMELVGTLKNEARVFVDYAHTPDAIKNVVRSAIADPNTGQLSIVFGCGGERDPSKRSEMAAATVLADRIYVTDDNPRRESAEQIRGQLVSELEKRNKPNFMEIPDRREAIETAISELRPGGTLIICGKGHEDYQEIKDPENSRKSLRIPFSDAAVVQAFLSQDLASPKGDEVSSLS